MPAHVKVSSAFQELSGIHVKVGGAYQEVQEGYIKVAGVWQPFFSNIIVSANTANISKSIEGATCYAGVRFQTDGTEDTLGPTNIWSNDRGFWLDAGSASEVWVERIVNSGTLNHLDPGAGRLQLNVDREYGISQVGLGSSTANVTFNFYNASSGGVLLDSVTLDITAERTTGA